MRAPIEIRGREMRIASPRTALDLGIGTVYQHPTLVPTLTVLENLMLGASWRAPMNRAATRARLSEITGLLGHRSAGGCAARLALARPAAARGDRQGAVAGRERADPRRGDLDAHAAGRRGPGPGHRAPARRRDRRPLHHPQAARGGELRRPGHGAAPGPQRRLARAGNALAGLSPQEAIDHIVDLMFGAAAEGRCRSEAAPNGTPHPASAW